MSVPEDVSSALSDLARIRTDALDRLYASRQETLDASGFDPQLFALVSLAALVASDAGPASYAFQIDQAVAAGVTTEALLGLLVAVNPLVGNVRTVSAAARITEVLGIDLDEEAGA